MPASSAHVKATLRVSGKDAALRLVHDPHWHTYWTNPGDSGLAPKMTPGALEFPAPERIVAGPRARDLGGKTMNIVLAAALDEAMAGKPVSTPSSTPYGCAVKY